MSSYLAFDATNINPVDEFQPIPAGSYPVIITDSEIKETKNGNGHYLKVALEIQGGEYQSRKIFHNITLDNPNATAVSIGQKHLSQICHSIGVLRVGDSAELHNKPLIAVVKICKGTGEYGDSNEVRRYEADPMAGAFAAPTAAPASATAAPPWMAGKQAA